MIPRRTTTKARACGLSFSWAPDAGFRRAGAAAACLALALAACAPAATRGGEAAVRLDRIVDRALAVPGLAGSGAGVLVVSLDRGDTLLARDADRLVTPASNLKLFTAAAALDALGPDHRFPTALLATGPVDGDTLRGDLVLVGRGDPELATADLAALADTLVLAGVRAVLGDVRADASWFDRTADWGSGWMWDDGPFWYWPWSSALTLNDNVVRLVARPGAAAGEPVAWRLEPDTRYVAVESAATTAAARTEPDLVVDRAWWPGPAGNRIRLSGTLPAGADSVVEERSVEEPALYAATVLVELLAARGVAVLGAVRHGPLAGAAADTVALHLSPPLAASVRNFLKISDNLSGEQYVKAIGAAVSGPPGSYASGLAAERAFLAGEVGLDTTRMRIVDGSGVSRYNLVTPRQIVRLLAYMRDRPDLAPAWLDALPVAGVDGTLENRMRGTPAEGRARAKTGTLSGVTSLSGYVPGADGETYAVSAIVEFFTGPSAPGRALQDSLVVALSRLAR